MAQDVNNDSMQLLVIPGEGPRCRIHATTPCMRACQATHAHKMFQLNTAQQHKCNETKLTQTVQGAQSYEHMQQHTVPWQGGVLLCNQCIQ